MFGRKLNKSVAELVVMEYSYDPQSNDELRLNKGDKVTVLEKTSDGWWKGQKANGKTGWFPSNFVEIPKQSIATPRSAFNKIMKSFHTPRVLEEVITLYAFEAQIVEELSFQKGERLEIIEHCPLDPEWWKARNSNGDVGLVPTNFVKVLESNPGSDDGPSASSSDVSSPYSRCAWYYGCMTRLESDELLDANGDEGDYFVRDSESNPGDYTISLKGDDRIMNFWVQVDGVKKFKIGTRVFSSMEKLLRHYTKHSIFTSERTYKRFFLVRPLPR